MTERILLAQRKMITCLSTILITVLNIENSESQPTLAFLYSLRSWQSSILPSELFLLPLWDSSPITQPSHVQRKGLQPMNHIVSSIQYLSRTWCLNRSNVSARTAPALEAVFPVIRKFKPELVYQSETSSEVEDAWTTILGCKCILRYFLPHAKLRD